MRYQVEVGGRRVRIETAEQDRLLVDGRVIAYEARAVDAGRIWSLVVEGRAHEVVLLGGDPPRVRIDGTETVLSITDERALAAKRDRSLAGGGRHEVRAPMAGLLKAIHVSEGDVVGPRDAIATLEAMKMENELRAPARGRVQRLAAAAGTKVESGSLIAVLVDETS